VAEAVDAAAPPPLTLEERFSAWIDPRDSSPAPLLIVGAGLSFGLAPAAPELAAMIATRKTDIEKELGIREGPAITDSASLYAWADHCLGALSAAMPDNAAIDAKIRLARAMGLMADKRYLAQAGVGPRGTTARHRVLARLAREGRVRAVWSFNWDCWLEASFEAVGMRRDDGASQQIANDRWMTRYQVWFKDAVNKNATDMQLLFKAHGCLRALHEGKGDFVIATSEMAQTLASQPSTRRDLLLDHTKGGSAIAVGWSASEPYIVELFATQQGKLPPPLTGTITFIDVKPDQPDQNVIRQAYSAQPQDKGVKVNGSGNGQTDDLMLWLQSKRGLRSLQEACDGLPSRAAVQLIEQRIPDFDAARMASMWPSPFFDDWLPVWLRCCFFTRAMEFAVPLGQELRLLPSERRDAHIPWGTPPKPRRDLRAAAALLLALDAGCQPECPWHFDAFPGAMWRPGDSHLVLPIPIWADPSRAARATIKPLVDALHWSDKARILTLTILPLDAADEALPADTPQRLASWKEAVASCFNHAALAHPSALKDCTLQNLPAPSAGYH
jgi:hypothetical protein